MNDELKTTGFQFIIHHSSFIVARCALRVPRGAFVNSSSSRRGESYFQRTGRGALAGLRLPCLSTARTPKK
jgi:hypothetical protein